jgi:hypothetical protein
MKAQEAQQIPVAFIALFAHCSVSYPQYEWKTSAKQGQGRCASLAYVDRRV